MPLAHLTQSIKYGVEVDENLPLRDLCNVVHALASKIAYTVLHIRKTDQEWVHEFRHVRSDFNTESDGCRR